MRKNFKWHSIADGKLPVSDEKVLLSTIDYGTVVGYYDIYDEAFFILSGAESRILHDEVVAWAEIPDCDVKKPTPNFRLPTKAELERLCSCYTRFDKELNGRSFYNEETGVYLFFPCDGYRSDATVKNAGLSGNYLSSTYLSSGTVYSFYFDGTIVKPDNYSNRDNGYSVRLVSDKPFEGAVHMVGLYWKPTNEDGYYTYDEAMGKFNKQ